MAPKELNAVLTHRADLAPGLAILRVEPIGWELPDFLPGQYAVLGLPGTAPRCAGSESEEPTPDPEALVRRAYSIASSSRAKEFLEFLVVLVGSGALTPRLFQLQPGDKLFLGPKIVGMFTLTSVPGDSNIVMVATGTGLAPYISMLRTHLNDTRWQRVAVLHGARHSWDLAYRDELAAMSRMLPNFVYLPIISRPQMEHEPWTGHTGYAQDLWTRGILETQWGCRPAAGNTHVFLCGNPAMIDTMLELLARENFREHTRKEPGQVHLERYW